MKVDWEGHVTDLLYEGEEPLGQIVVDEDWLVVTSHRVLRYRPAARPAFRQVDRPNVVGVDASLRGDFGYLAWALKLGVPGVLLVALAATFSAVGLLGPPVEGATSLDVFFGSLTAVGGLAETTVKAFGVGLVVAGLLAVALYVRSRQHVVVVAVAGAPDVRFPVPNTARLRAGAERIEQALRSP